MTLNDLCLKDEGGVSMVWLESSRWGSSSPRIRLLLPSKSIVPALNPKPLMPLKKWSYSQDWGQAAIRALEAQKTYTGKILKFTEEMGPLQPPEPCSLTLVNGENKSETGREALHVQALNIEFWLNPELSGILTGLNLSHTKKIEVSIDENMKVISYFVHNVRPEFEVFEVQELKSFSDGHVSCLIDQESSKNKESTDLARWTPEL